MNRKDIPREIVEGFDQSISEDQINDWVQIQAGLNDSWGETNLLLTKTSFVVMNRNSFSDPWNFITLDPLHTNAIKLYNCEETLYIKDLHGKEFAVQIVSLERDAVVAFLQRLSLVKSSLQSVVEKTPITKVQVKDQPHLAKATSTPQQKQVTEEDLINQLETLVTEADTMGDSYTDAIWGRVDSLAAKAEKFGFDTGDDPLEQIGDLLEAFFIKQGKAAFQEGSNQRIKLAEKFKNLKDKLRPRDQETKSTLTPNERNDFKTFLNTGKLLGKNKKTISQAITSYEKALELNPTSPIAHMEIGDLLLKQENFIKSINHFQKVIENSDDKIIKREVLLKLAAIYTKNLGDSNKGDLFLSMAEKL